MLRTIDIDLTNENVWFDLSTSYKKYDLSINHLDGSDINIKLEKGQLEELLKEFLSYNFFEVDEDGEVCIVNI